MKKVLISTAIAALGLALPAMASAQFSYGGTVMGAGIGGAIGSNLAGSGVQDEGTASGAALGGLVGNHIATNRSGFNGYGGSFGAPNYNGGNFGNALIGAGIGGAIGSNLAASGVQDEGTAIGAVLGGLVGNSFGSTSAPATRSRYAGSTPYSGASKYGASQYGASRYGSDVQGGFGYSESYSYGYTMPVPTPVPSRRVIGYQSSPVFTRSYTLPAPAARPVLRPAPLPPHCPTGTAPQPNGTCLIVSSSYKPPVASRSVCNRQNVVISQPTILCTPAKTGYTISTSRRPQISTSCITPRPVKPTCH